MSRALIYTRVSQDRSGGRSPAEQESEARALCEREGWEVAEVVTDSAGASRHSKGTRAGWKRAKEILRSGTVDVLVTWEASRAQRDLEAYAELRDLCVTSGVLWSYSGRVYDLSVGDDRFRTGLDALLAEREAEETANRVQRAVRANAAAGRPHGRRLYGYKRVYDETSGALVTQVPHPDEAPVVRRIFDDYLAGAGVRTVAARLNAEEIPTSTGKRWTDAQVRDVLMRPSYTGLRVHQGVVIGEAVWEPLVDRDRFQRVQARLEAKRTSSSRQTRTANLLTGVSRCGVCGGKVQRGHDRNRRKTYVCKSKFCVTRDLDKLDAYVSRIILDRLSRPDASDALTSSSPAPEVLAARSEVVARRAQLADATSQFVAGRLTAGTLARIEADLLPLIAAAESKVRQATVPLDIAVPVDDLDYWWNHTLTAEQRREVASAVVLSITLLPAKRGSRTFDPTAVKVELRF